MLSAARAWLVYAVVTSAPTWEAQVEAADRLRLEGNAAEASVAYGRAYRALPAGEQSSLIGDRIVRLALAQARLSRDSAVMREASVLADLARSNFSNADREASEELEAAQRELEAQLTPSSEPPPEAAEASDTDPSSPAPASPPEGATKIPADASEAPAEPTPPGRSHRASHIAYWTSAAILAAAGVSLWVVAGVRGDGSEEVANVMDSPEYDALRMHPEAFTAYNENIAAWQQRRESEQIALWTCGGISLAVAISVAVVDLAFHTRRRSNRVTALRGLTFRF